MKQSGIHCGKVCIEGVERENFFLRKAGLECEERKKKNEEVKKKDSECQLSSLLLKMRHLRVI